MSKHYANALGQVGAVETGTSANCENLDPVCINVYGTFVGTYTIEGSVDGTNFSPLLDIFGNSLAGLTAPTWAQLPAGLKSVRLDMTAWTSGAADANVGGMDKTLKD
jgi:hypothetical protein